MSVIPLGNKCKANLLGVQLILLYFISILILTLVTFVLSPWKEKAKSFLLGVQLGFSLNILYISTPRRPRDLFDGDNDDEVDFFCL